MKTAVTQRVFDVPAVNGFLLSDYKKDLFEIFGDDAVCFHNEMELNDKIRFFLTHERERLAYIERLHSIVCAEHTYLKRFNQIIDTLDEKLL